MDYRHIALVSELQQIAPVDLARVSAAIQRQVVEDFAPIWNVSATIDPFPDLDHVPVGYWTILITAKDLGAELGVHYDDAGQPHAVVELSDSWSISASHECLEMLLDPWGNRVTDGVLPGGSGQRVQYLLEVCDPCQDASFAYPINDMLVSEFYTPAYLEPARPGARYSCRGSLSAPLTILKGGYLSWYDPLAGNWYQRDDQGQTTNLGPLKGGAGSMRQQVNAHTRDHLGGTHISRAEVRQRLGNSWEAAKAASLRQGEALRRRFFPHRDR